MLQRISDTPGLWRTGSANGSGLHALVIGISAYPYLSGGSAPAHAKTGDTGGLGQLVVSAYSAALFFKWIVEIGVVAGAPLASIRLHLSPRHDELALIDAILGPDSHGDATFEVLRSAVKSWSDEISRGGRSGSSPNVALFFFSGHGVEVGASPAILASDVLNQLTADKGASHAIAVEPMTLALKTYDIDRGLFLVDACRNSPRAARLIDLSGERVLKPNSTPIRRPDALIRLHSTASGLKSYQVENAEGTLFTQALLDGLNGMPPHFKPYDTTSEPWPLKFAALEGYVKTTVQRLLAGHSATATQPVEPYGNPYNGEMIVAHKQPIAESTRVLPPAAQLSLQDDADRARTQPRQQQKFGRGEIANYRSFWHRHHSDLLNRSIMRPIFGRDLLSETWLRALRLLDARTGQPEAPSAVSLVGARRDETPDRVAIELDLLVAPASAGPLWVGLNGGELCYTGLIVPRDPSNRVPVCLTVLYELDPTGMSWQLNHMGARLAELQAAGENNGDVWSILAKAQRAMACSDLASATTPLTKLEDLQAVVMGKRDSPIAAAVAVGILLKSSNLQFLHDWPRNLANWFWWLPDGPILWAETLLRRQTGDPSQDAKAEREAFRYFLRIASRGVPLLPDTLLFAFAQADRWRDADIRATLDESASASLDAALERLDQARQYVRSSDGFARFATDKPNLSPTDVLGPSASLSHEINRQSILSERAAVSPSTWAFVSRLRDTLRLNLVWRRGRSMRDLASSYLIVGTVALMTALVYFAGHLFLTGGGPTSVVEAITSNEQRSILAWTGAAGLGAAMFGLYNLLYAGLGSFLLPRFLGNAKPVHQNWSVAAFGMQIVSIMAFVVSVSLAQQGEGRVLGVDGSFWLAFTTFFGSVTVQTTVFLIMILKHRPLGMTLHRSPIAVWGLLVGSPLFILAAGSGFVSATLNYFARGEVAFAYQQGLGWALSDGLLLALMITCMSYISHLTSVFSSKAMFAYLGQAYGLVLLGVLSLAVITKHAASPLAGIGAERALLLMPLAMSVPMFNAVFSWLATLYRGSIRFEPPLLWTLAAIAAFQISIMGGLFGLDPLRMTVSRSQADISLGVEGTICFLYFATMASGTYWLRPLHEYQKSSFSMLQFWLAISGLAISTTAKVVFAIVESLSDEMMRHEEPLLELASLTNFGNVVLLGSVLPLFVWVVIRFLDSFVGDRGNSPDGETEDEQTETGWERA